MDIKVYKKEEVLQPDGNQEVYVPDIIDLVPVLEDGSDVIKTCELVEDRNLLEQQCALVTIWQRGLDPVDINDGIRWSEALLEEISSLQLIQDIIEAVASVTSSVSVQFDTVEDDKGNSYLSYKLVEAV